MKDPLQNPRAGRGPKAKAETVRSPVRNGLLLALVAVGCVAGYQLWKWRQGPPPGPLSKLVDPANQDPQTERAAAAPSADVAVVQPGSPADSDDASGPETEGEPVNQPVALPVEGLSLEPTPYTRQLVATLTDLDPGRGPLTPEQSEQWKAGLQVLVQQGSSAVPAIREFLEQNRDLDLGPGSSLGYPSVRAGLLDALQQIGGPEAQALMLQTLQITSMPSEIARLARYLELQGPGQFRTEIGTAVRETLAQAAGGQLRGWDVGPLFQVLQTYSDAATVAALEKSAPKWNYYSALALANLPTGEGVPSLIRLAQESPGTTARGVALEALAQVAIQYPNASAALVELARSGKFSERNWLTAVAALGGERYFIRDSGVEDAPVPTGSGVRNYHLEASNQNFYSIPPWGGMSPEQINERVGIIDQLLAVSSSPAVTQALQNTRASLLTKGQQASAN